MPIMQVGYRDNYALLLAEHPTMRDRAAHVEANTVNLLNLSVNESGAHISCPHYMGAGIEPTLGSFLQLRMLGKDHFKTEERLTRFAEFYMNLLTPPEIRYGGRRKMISEGDGPTESTDMCGLMATGFRVANPDLNARLQGAWIQGGKRHSGFFASSLFMIDEAAPAKDPALGSATFPGYCSVLRNGWGTSNETAIWFVNGGYLRDHRHNDSGELIIYALGAPLSLDWGSQYEPHVPSAFMHSTVLPETSIPHSWSADNVPLGPGGSPWDGGTQEAFVSFSTAAYARARFVSKPTNTTWTRSVMSLHPDEAHPAIVIRDTFEGATAAGSRVSTLNLLAEGAVETPAGPIQPALRTWVPNKELPAAGQVFTLQPGVNRLRFRGQQFGKRVTVEGATISGGPTELLLRDAAATLTLHGAGGTRSVKLPGNWRLSTPGISATQAAGAWLIDYAGGKPLTLAFTSN